MKKFKWLLILVLLFVSVLSINSSKIYASEVEYTSNVIPTMTSPTSPTGIASASSEFKTADYYPAYLAFDKIATTHASAWVAAKGVLTGWLAYEFPEEKCITKYTIEPRNWVGYTSQSPKDWTFEAWDNQSNTWVILDSRKNITDWKIGSKNVFTFLNTNLYQKYRINITAIGDSALALTIGELEMMETVAPPTNLSAKPANSSVLLTWNSIVNAQRYVVKRSTTPNGPYVNIGTISTNTYNDTDVENETTYYYVITSIISGIESTNSNEVNATPSAVVFGNSAILEITMTNGGIKTYDLTFGELDSFLTWYDNHSKGTDKSYYVFTKKSNIRPFLNNKEYIVFDKISSFEVKEYAE